MNSSKRYDTTKQWYAIHTYSGYEEKVAESIRQRADSLDMSDKIFQVLVPKEKMIEIKNGKRRVVEKRIFQGYVLVEMKLSEDAWYIVRNTPSVTGFVGSGADPTPLEADEIEKIQKQKREKAAVTHCRVCKTGGPREKGGERVWADYTSRSCQCGRRYSQSHHQ